MPQSGEGPGRPLEQFATDAATFEVRQNHEDLDFTGVPRAEAVADDFRS